MYFQVIVIKLRVLNVITNIIINPLLARNFSWWCELKREKPLWEQGLLHLTKRTACLVKRPWSLCAVVLRTVTKCTLIRATCLACLKMMILTIAQHTLHTYFHVSFHQDQELDHFPLCIQVVHLSHKAERHYIYPEEQGRNLTFAILITMLTTTVFRNFIELSASLSNAH